MNRRNFLNTLTISGISLGLTPWNIDSAQVNWPLNQKLGRVCIGGKVEIRSRASADSTSVGVLFEDGIVDWVKEVVGERPTHGLSRRWVETTKGFIYAPNLQQVENRPNKPLSSLPAHKSLGEGIWAEVTIPYVDIYLDNPPARSPYLKEAVTPRLYYSQVVWVDKITTNSQGKVLYRVKEKFGYGDIFWCIAEGFRPLTPEEMSPIRPEIEDKRVRVDLNRQTLSCLEGKNEVFFCRISSGAKFDASGNVVEKWATPVGPHRTWRKQITTHMSGGTTGGGFDLPGIAWTILFSGDGVAIHSTFWHNDYGVPRSHGCVNASPEDAKWIFRWTNPQVSYDPGDVTVQMPGGTVIEVLGS